MEEIKKKKRQTRPKVEEESHKTIDTPSSLQVEYDIPEIIFDEDEQITLQTRRDEDPIVHSSRRGSIGKKILRYLFLLILLYLGWRLASSFSRTAEELAQKELAETIDMVAKHIELPPNESPTIATVSNLEALKQQPFFKNSKIGDKVLIYSASRKAILYRPETDRIIEVAPFSFNNSAPNVEKSN